jgi:hypothetical protein
MLFWCDTPKYQERDQLPFEIIQMLSQNHSIYSKVIPIQSRLDDLIFVIQ